MPEHLRTNDIWGCAKEMVRIGAVIIWLGDDVEEEVQQVTTAAAHGGGYIISGAYNIQPDTSVEKIAKLFEWSKKYGVYPIQQL